MNDLIITKRGQQLVSDMVAGAATAAFTKIRTSDRIYAANELEALETLADVKQEALISSVTRTDPAFVELLVLLDNRDVANAYNIRALGVYATDDDGDEILFAVAIDTGTPDAMPAYGGKTVSEISYHLVLRVAASDRVELTVNSAAAATIGQVKQLTGEVDLERGTLQEQIDALEAAVTTFDTSLVDAAFARIFTHIHVDGEAMSYEDITRAISTVWDGQSTVDETALSAAEVATAIASNWDGSTSTDETAIERETIAQITSVKK